MSGRLGEFSNFEFSEFVRSPNHTDVTGDRFTMHVLAFTRATSYTAIEGDPNTSISGDR
jgi:hypothetical protein